MISSFEIYAIKARATHAVRHPVLRKGRPKSSCFFEADEKDSSLHLGAFKKERLIGVCSAYHRQHLVHDAKKPFQIRGVAVLPANQGEGIGRALMERMEEKLREINCDFIWLNARENAVPFYQRLDYHSTGDPFFIDKIGVHYGFYKTL